VLKILLVEDDLEKKRLITKQILKEAGIKEDFIDIESDARNAKKRISKKHYDLVILDINLPLKIDGHVTKGGGLDVLTFIKSNMKSKQPRHIVGLTAFDDAFDLASSEFNSLIFKLIKFNYATSDWKDALSESLHYLVVHDTPPYINDGVTFHTDIAVICALEEELDAVLSTKIDWNRIDVPYNGLMHYSGTLELEDNSLSIVAVSTPGMGMPTAGVISANIISTFRPKLVVMTGICAGVRGKTNFGDILVADPCFDWGSGKWVRCPLSGDLKFRPAHYQWRLNQSLRESVLRTAKKVDLLQSIHKAYGSDKPESSPKVIVNAMASGGSVLQANSLMDDVKEQHKNLVGLEMESYAVFTAAEYSSDPKPKCISIKSVCDFGDEDKGEDFRHYASFTSAEFFVRFVEEIDFDVL
jgi:nucleoside phosphorylase